MSCIPLCATLLFPLWLSVAKYFKFHPFLQNSFNECMLQSINQNPIILIPSQVCTFYQIIQHETAINIPADHCPILYHGTAQIGILFSE